MLTVTDEARNELKNILEQNPGKSLRVTMAGFGWGGPSLGLTLDESTDEDKKLVINEIEILVDAQVERFTDDQVIHFVQDGFTITSTNGGSCGSCSGSCS